MARESTDAIVVEDGQNSANVSILAFNQSTKKPQACVPCHERKVKCNATQVGLPCTRCTNRKQVASCVLKVPPRKNRSSLKIKRNSVSCVVVDHHVSPTSSASPEDTRAEAGDANDLSLRLNSPNFETSMLSTTGAAQESDAGVGDYAPERMHADLGPEQTDGVHQSAGAVNTWGEFNREDPGVCEEDAHLQICREMSQWATDPLSPTRMGRAKQGREVIEYHEGINSITILSEVFGQNHPRKLVRIVLSDPDPPAGKQREISGLDEADIEYLQGKKAFDLPPRQICDEFIQIYFKCIYPYAPILDRVDFLQAYEGGNYSSFLVQSILANVVPYASLGLLFKAGFSDRPTAQKSFFTKAKLLYDFGCETSQLRLLQGSLMLGSLSIIFAVDKDFRFWLTNAVRISTQMGLHRDGIAKNLDTSTCKLLRRIWWVVYNRDVLLTVAGLENVRRLHDHDCDTSALTEDDWEETIIPSHLENSLPPIGKLHRVYLIESCKLARISAQFIHTFRSPGLLPSESSMQDLEHAISTWRHSLPAEMHFETVWEWSTDNIWILVILAMGYRLESVYYRTLRERYRANEDQRVHWAAQRQQSAMYELDTIINRVVRHNVVQLCPLSIMTCVSTVLAMHIETALNSATASDQKLLVRTHIHAGLSYLRESCQYWAHVKWTLRMFEVIVARTGLSLTAVHEAQFDIQSMNPFETAKESVTQHGNPDDIYDMADMDALGSMMGRNADEWLQDLLGSNFTDPYEDSATITGNTT